MSTPNVETVKSVVDLPEQGNGLLAGCELSGSIFRSEDGGLSVQKPGGRNFGGILHPAIEIADLNGRQIAISGSFDEAGDRSLSRLEELIKTAYYNFMQSPNTHSAQMVYGTRVRFEKRTSSNPKSPIASYFVTL